MAPPSAVVPTIPTICSESAATTSAYWRWLRPWGRLGAWRRLGPIADTTAQSTRHQHVIGVSLTFSTEGPRWALFVLICARRRRLRPWRRLRRAGTATRSTISQHVVGVSLTFSIGGPTFALLILIRARWRRLRPWRWLWSAGRLRTWSRWCWCRRGPCDLKVDTGDEGLSRT